MHIQTLELSTPIQLINCTIEKGALDNKTQKLFKQNTLANRAKEDYNSLTSNLYVRLNYEFNS